MLNILSRRYPAGNGRALSRRRCRGTGAARTLIDGIRALNAAKACDLIIIGRGGGSIEDLWAFNDETLARAIAASGIPVISAVGHETDFTIADFAADLRAPTPSAAAELAVPNMADLRYYLAGSAARAATGRPPPASRRHGAPAAHSMRAGLDDPREGCLRACGDCGWTRWNGRSARAFCRRLERRAKPAGISGALVEERSPMKILSRGYSLTSADGRTVLSAEQVKPGDLLDDAGRRRRDIVESDRDE